MLKGINPELPSKLNKSIRKEFILNFQIPKILLFEFKSTVYKLPENEREMEEHKSRNIKVESLRKHRRAGRASTNTVLKPFPRKQRVGRRCHISSILYLSCS